MFENLTIEECVYLVLMTSAAMAVLVALVHCLWCICRCQRKRKGAKKFPTMVGAESRTLEVFSSHMDVTNVGSGRTETNTAALTHDPPVELQQFARSPKQNTPTSAKTDASDTFEYKGIKFPPIIRFETKSSGNHGHFQASFSKEDLASESIGEPSQGINLTTHNTSRDGSSATNSLPDEVFGSVEYESDESKHNYDVIPLLPPGRRSVHCTPSDDVKESHDSENNPDQEDAGLLLGEATLQEEGLQRVQHVATPENECEPFPNGYVKQSGMKSELILDTSYHKSSNPSIDDDELAPGNDGLYSVPKCLYHSGYVNIGASTALTASLMRNVQGNISALTVQPGSNLTGLSVDPVGSVQTNNDVLKEDPGSSGGLRLERESSEQTDSSRVNESNQAKTIVLKLDQGRSEETSNSGLKVNPDSSGQTSYSGLYSYPGRREVTSISGLTVDPDSSGHTSNSGLTVDPRYSEQTNISGLPVDPDSSGQTSGDGLYSYPGGSEKTSTSGLPVDPDSSGQTSGDGLYSYPGWNERTSISGLTVDSGSCQKSTNDLKLDPENIYHNFDNTDGYVMKDSVNVYTPSVCQGATATDKTGYITMSGTVQGKSGSDDVDINQSLLPQTLSEIQQEILSRYYPQPDQTLIESYEGVYGDEHDVGYEGGYVNWKGSQAPRRFKPAEEINDTTYTDASSTARKS